jgi:hypothetical protein
MAIRMGYLKACATSGEEECIDRLDDDILVSMDHQRRRLIQA